MSNINPDPRFIPTPGTPTAAKSWPTQTRTMAEVEADEEALKAQSRDWYNRERKSWRASVRRSQG